MASGYRTGRPYGGMDFHSTGAEREDRPTQNNRDFGPFNFYRSDTRATDSYRNGTEPVDSVLLSLADSSPASIADQVFGAALARAGAGKRNLQDLLSWRRDIHYRNLQEINERCSELANRLDFARRPYTSLTMQDVSRIEKSLLEMEGKRRQEFVDYWTDVARERKEFIEALAEYAATRERATLLSSIAPAVPALYPPIVLRADYGFAARLEAALGHEEKEDDAF